MGTIRCRSLGNRASSDPEQDSWFLEWDSGLPTDPGLRQARRMAEEIFDVVNERDEVIGQRPRSEVHRLHLNHRAVHVLVFNRRGDLLLQKRSMRKDCFPGTWDSSSSGHLDQGEAYDACAVRELREEIGLTVGSVPERLFYLAAEPATGHEFVWVYRCQSEGPFELQVTEVDRVEWFHPDVLTSWIERRPEDFASAFIVIWRKWLANPQVLR